MRQKTFLAAAAVTTLIGSGAMAATVSIDTIDSTWQNAVGGGATVVFNNVASPGTDTVSWGTNGTSSYSFTPNMVSFDATDGIPFSLGTFVHDNQPINNPTISSVDLALTFGGTPVPDPDGVGEAMFDTVFTFNHNETNNTGGGCCNDIVSVSAAGGPDQTVVAGGLVYTFTLLGFSALDPADPMFEGSLTVDFSTIEGQANASDLWASFSVTPVPLPAAGWLLLAGVGGLAAAGRRRKKA